MTPYQEGQSAYSRGDTLQSNPYEYPYPEWEEWNQGYIDRWAEE